MQKRYLEVATLLLGLAALLAVLLFCQAGVTMPNRSWGAARPDRGRFDASGCVYEGPNGGQWVWIGNQWVQTR